MRSSLPLSMLGFSVSLTQNENQLQPLTHWRSQLSPPHTITCRGNHQPWEHLYDSTSKTVLKSLHKPNIVKSKGVYVNTVRKRSQGVQPETGRAGPEEVHKIVDKVYRLYRQHMQQKCQSAQTWSLAYFELLKPKGQLGYNLYTVMLQMLLSCNRNTAH